MHDRFLLNIRHFILENGFKHKYVADKIGMSDQAFSNFINGRNSADIDIVPKLCDVLGCTPNDLYEIHNKAS